MNDGIIRQSLYLKNGHGLGLAVVEISEGKVAFLPSQETDDLTLSLTQIILHNLRHDLLERPTTIQIGYLRKGTTLAPVKFEITRKRVLIYTPQTEKYDPTLPQTLQALEELSGIMNEQKIPHETHMLKMDTGTRIDTIIIKLKT